MGTQLSLSTYDEVNDMPLDPSWFTAGRMTRERFRHEYREFRRILSCIEEHDRDSWELDYALVRRFQPVRQDSLLWLRSCRERQVEALRKYRGMDCPF